MPSPEKFRDTLDAFGISREIIDDMYLGFGPLCSKTSKKTKSAFFAQALHVMNSSLPAETVKEVLSANACCKSGARLKNSREFARIHAGLSIPDRLRLISARPYMHMGHAELDEDGCLVVHSVAYHPGDKFECACPTVSKVRHDPPIPREYCYCCGGHFLFHYEIMLGAKLKLVEIVSSPHDTDGRRPCVFRYSFTGREG